MKPQWIATGLLLALCLTGCGGQERAVEGAELSGGTAQPQAAAPQADFSDTALVGNSYIDSFSIYDAMPGAAYYYRVGLDVNTALTQPMLHGDDTQTPVVDLLAGGDFDHIILFFGENELGWPNRDVFQDGYAKVIAAVRGHCPDAAVYLSAIPPVSAAASEKNEDNTNNASIQACNEEIRQIAEANGAVYIDAFTALADENGCLPEDAAADGVHPAKEYTEKWAALLAQGMGAAQ